MTGLTFPTVFLATKPGFLQDIWGISNPCPAVCVKIKDRRSGECRYISRLLAVSKPDGSDETST